MDWLLIFLLFQAAEEPELPVAPNVGLESADRAVVLGDTVSPSPNGQLPSAAIVPSTSIMDDSASTLASLRMVCFNNQI